MIDVGFIHAFDEIENIHKEYVSDVEAINTVRFDLSMIYERVKDFELFESYNSENTTEDIFQESIGSVITKFGELIIKMVNACKDFIKEKMKQFQEYRYKSMSDSKKIDAIAHKLEKESGETGKDAAKKIEMAVRAGDITLTDFKSMKEFSENVDDLLKQIENGFVDEKSLKGKMNAIKKKLSDSSDTIIKVGAVASATTAIILSYTRIKELVAKTDKTIEESSKEIDRKLDNYRSISSAASKIANDPNIDKNYASKLSMKTQVIAMAKSEYQGHISKWMSLKVKLCKKIDKIYTSLLGDSERMENYKKSIDALDSLKKETDKKVSQTKTISDRLHKKIDGRNVEQKVRDGAVNFKASQQLEKMGMPKKSNNRKNTK